MSARVKNAISLVCGTGVSLAKVKSVVVDTNADNDANTQIDFMSQPES